MKKFYTILIFCIVCAVPCSGQNFKPVNSDSIRLSTIEAKLAELTQVDTTYNGTVDISTGKMALSELLRNVAKASRVNLSVKGAENTMVTCNFSRIRITDLIYFICKEYNLDIDVIGNIVSIHPLALISPKIKEPKIEYKISRNQLSYDLAADKLIDVSKRISALTGQNLIIPQSLYTLQVSGYVKEMSFDEAIFTLGSVNNIEVEKNKNSVWTFVERPIANAQGGGQTPMPSYTRRNAFAPNQLSVDSLGRITAQIGRGNISDIILDLCGQNKLDYFFVAPISQQTSIYVRDVDFNTLLSVMFSGTQYTYYCEHGIYIFGTKEVGVSSVKLIPLTYRSVNKVEELIPATIKNGLEIKQFADQNSLIVSGDQRQITRVEAFISSIDRRVPLVTIEILIANVTKRRLNEAGVKAGLGKSVESTTGSYSPSIDMNLNPSSVNSLINKFNGFGSVNLGRVGDDFYMSLKLLEEDGVVELLSTPKLSTLNGHEATMKSGETRYYKEINNSIIGTQNPIQSESFTWKSLDANLTIKITPYVSEDNQITLDIEIEQSEFTVQEEKGAPPGSTTRNFKSLIRVQNEEMVLLGGLDHNTKIKSSSGLPFIARVPLIKSIFGYSTDNKIDKKLNVFIKPTIIN